MRIAIYYKEPVKKGFIMIDHVYSFKLRGYLAVDYKSDVGFKRYIVASDEIESFVVYL